jgi:PhnB protein
MAAETQFPGIAPYLTIDGASAAIDFYKAAFGAEEMFRQMAEGGRRVMHCSLRINGGTVMLSDSFPEPGTPGPDPARPSPVAINLALADPAEVDRIAARAREQGATITMGPEDTFWGARFAQLTDPFGHRWMLNADLKR